VKEQPLPEKNAEAAPETPALQISLLKALVPLVPLVLLFLTAPPLQVFTVPQSWVVERTKDGTVLGSYESRLIGAAMLVGVVVAAAAVRSRALDTARAFFEGAGYAYTHIISLIVVAACFGEGIKQIGLATLLGSALESQPGLLFPAAGLMSLGFGVLSGSGMATTQSLFGFFAEPALRLHIHPAYVGAVISLAAAAGRTMSPVAAVTLMCAAMTQTEPVALIKRVAGPLLVGVLGMVLTAALRGGNP
jgi:DcuC family C4-dicarboxylate transporter